MKRLDDFLACVDHLTATHCGLDRMVECALAGPAGVTMTGETPEAAIRYTRPGPGNGTDSRPGDHLPVPTAMVGLPYIPQTEISVSG